MKFFSFIIYALFSLFIGCHLYGQSAGQPVFHTIEPGETIVSIANTYGAQTRELMEWNDLRNLDQLEAGGVLVVGYVKPAVGSSSTPNVSQTGTRSIGGQVGSRSINSSPQNARTATPQSTVNPVMHKVKKGETYSSITRKYKLQGGDIQEWNNLYTKDFLREGQDLIVGFKSGPAFGQSGEGTRSLGNTRGISSNAAQPKYHTVKKGETLYGLSRKYKVSPEELVNMNAIANINKIVIGQQVIVGYENTSSAASSSQVNRQSQGTTRNISSEPQSEPQQVKAGQHLAQINNSESTSSFQEKRKQELEKDTEDYGSNVFAVVVGVADYPHIRKLRYTDDDAYEFYAHLRSPEGGQVPADQIAILVDENATYANIHKYMEMLFRKTKQGDVVIFYFAGHGIEGAFLPFDYDGTHNALTHEEVQRLFLTSNASARMIFSDACYSGTLGQLQIDVSNIPQVQINEYYQKLKESMKLGFALTACSGTEEALEVQGIRHGVFTYYLILGLLGAADMNKDTYVTAGELFPYLKDQIQVQTSYRQEPPTCG